MHSPETHAAPESAEAKLLEAVVVMEKVHARWERAVAELNAGDDARASARALRGESAPARWRARRLMREAAALVARAEGLVAEARNGSEPGSTGTLADSPGR
jgi:hypothetical protein